MGQTIFQYKHFPTDPLYFPVEPASTTVIEEALRDTIHIPYFAPVGGADTIARLIPSGKVIFSGIEFKLFMFYFKYEFELFNFLKLRSLYFIILVMQIIYLYLVLLTELNHLKLTISHLMCTI